jgi:peroxiredoxin
VQPAAPPTEPASGPTLVPPTNEPKVEAPPPSAGSNIESTKTDNQASRVDGEAPSESAAAAPKPGDGLAKDEIPQERTAFFRAADAPAVIPKVLLSNADEAACLVKVGDPLPAIKLPQLDGSGEVQLADKYGERATVVVFWKSNRRMARQQLADLGPDVIEPFGKNGVTVIGIAVNEGADSAQAALKKAGAEFLNLLDADGKAFAQVGKERLPRTYLLDAQGKILWFDIEYSPATRRELQQALRAVAGTPAAAAADKPTLGEASSESAPAIDKKK